MRYMGVICCNFAGTSGLPTDTSENPSSYACNLQGLARPCGLAVLHGWLENGPFD